MCVSVPQHEEGVTVSPAPPPHPCLSSGAARPLPDPRPAEEGKGGFGAQLRPAVGAIPEPPSNSFDI
ncbi:unnamed protein product [Gadus morhua 'NCC']